MNSTDTFHDDSVCLPISHNFLYFQAMLRILGESGLIGESDRIGLLQQAASAAKTTPTSATTTTAAPSITTRRSTFFSDLASTAAKKGDSGKGKYEYLSDCRNLWMGIDCWACTYEYI